MKKSINRSHYLIVISFFDPAWYQTLIFNFVTECQNAIVFGIEIWVLIELRINVKRMSMSDEFIHLSRFSIGSLGSAPPFKTH